MNERLETVLKKKGGDIGHWSLGFFFLSEMHICTF